MELCFFIMHQGSFVVYGIQNFKDLTRNLRKRKKIALNCDYDYSALCLISGKK